MSVQGITPPSKESIFGEERTGLGPMEYGERHQRKPYCTTCRYAMRGVYGWKNGRCYKFQGEKGKPNDILFHGATCPYYRKDRSNSKKEEPK